MLAVPKTIRKILLSLGSPELRYHFPIANVRPPTAASMSIDPGSINIAAADMLSAFQRRVDGIPYERKGILYSEMFFLYLCAQSAMPNRVVESGRARGQSTSMLSTIFSDSQVVSIESDPHSPDVQVAQDRVAAADDGEIRAADRRVGHAH